MSEEKRTFLEWYFKLNEKIAGLWFVAIFVGPIIFWPVLVHFFSDDETPWRCSLVPSQENYVIGIREESNLPFLSVFETYSLFPDTLTEDQLMQIYNDTVRLKAATLVHVLKFIGSDSTFSKVEVLSSRNSLNVFILSTHLNNCVYSKR